MLFRRPLLALWFAGVLAACGSGGDDDGVGDVDGGGTGPDAGVPDCDELLCLQPPARGFQVRSIGQVIHSGQDIEYCEAVQLPGDPSDVYYVNRLESEMSPSSHHLIVTAAEVGSPTEAAITGPGDTRQCTSSREFGADLLPVTGNQHPFEVEQFPPGVGRVYHGGQYLIFDYHYLNLTDGDIMAQAAVNFHTVDEADVQKIARSFGFYNFGIYTPAGETSSHTAECTFSTDIVVYNLTRHTHQWGTDFTAWFFGGDRDGDMVWTTPDYETDTDFVFEPVVELGAGEGFRFQCNFDNTTNGDLMFGTEATDEMCILFGVWWEAGDVEAPSQSCQRL